ncbi:MarR family winged helix-turn-helix transcriptional regulator [Paenibacillus aestuarii]|uniref:MarR family winged helix-turn-helix transcriptional regulator n=1 Tax=Paenibacillus aestuarii TaxID=516965 RepID=A0ABW0KC43_9BACL|nr:MarR family transcriptional regulator [Paenibacillus aestuarii]
MDSQMPTGERVPTSGEVIQAIIRTAHFVRHVHETGSTAMGVPSYVTGPRLRVLGIVSDHGPIRMNDLAAKMGIRAITVTQFVDALEKENLLMRLPDPTDRRATLLQLTENAPELLIRAREASRQVSEKMLERVTPQMRRQLLDILAQIGDFEQGWCVAHREESKPDEKNVQKD